MIAVVMTVLNEGESLARLLDSLAAQTRPPDEVIVVDGGSDDGTLDLLRRYAGRLPLRVLVEPGCNISAGRNRAIAAAQADLIAVTDAGVVLAPDWLENITRPLLADPAVQVVGGFFRAAPHTPFEVAMGATVLPLADEIRPETFLPSSRSVAFRKAAWERAGGYPEWLDYCEDLVFDLRLRQTAGPFAFVPAALVDFRPRGSLRAFWTQYYRYARGDGKADLWRRRHLIRYLTYSVAAPTLALVGLLLHPIAWAALLAGAALYLRGPYRRLPHVLARFRPCTPLERLRIAAWIPIIRVVGDLAKMAGYPAGVGWRRRHRPPNWRQV